MIDVFSLQTAVSGIILASWEIFTDAAPYLFLGFGVAGLLNVLIPDHKIIDYLGTSAGKVRSVINASLAGLPLPLCSCGVIPAAMSIRKRGANRGATLSFLISTPQTGVDSIAITYALLDPLMTVFRPLATLVTALAAGLANNLLLEEEPELKQAREKNEIKNMGEKHAENCNFKESIKTKVLAGLRYAYIELPGEIAKWMLLGIVIAGFISYIVPDTLIQEYLGGGIRSMLVMLLIGIPLYICATASTPLAASLVAKGMSPGTAFVFLLAGPATNAATITMVVRFLGKRSAALYLGIIAICSLGAGILLDWLYLKLGISVTANIGNAADMLPHELKTGFALLLLPLMLYGALQEEKECNC